MTKTNKDTKYVVVDSTDLFFTRNKTLMVYHIANSNRYKTCCGDKISSDKNLIKTTEVIEFHKNGINKYSTKKKKFVLDRRKYCIHCLDKIRKTVDLDYMTEQFIVDILSKCLLTKEENRIVIKDGDNVLYFIFDYWSNTLLFNRKRIYIKLQSLYGRQKISYREIIHNHLIKHLGLPIKYSRDFRSRHVLYGAYHISERYAKFIHLKFKY